MLVVSKDSVGATNQQTMEETHWANTFPPIAQPLKLPLWLLETHAGAMLGYPVGGPNWGSTFSLLCVVAGVAVLVRRRQWLFLGLLLGAAGVELHRRRVASLPLWRPRADDALSRPGLLHAHRRRADGRLDVDRGPATGSPRRAHAKRRAKAHPA